VVELGSNDGIMLKNFAEASVRHLGIEPSANVAEAARQKGVRTISQFFDEGLASEILVTDGPADAILGANVMCHIPYIHSVFAGVKKLLQPRGVLVFEDPYLGDIVEKISYDQIYDEHAFYFSAESVSFLAARHDLELIDVLPQNVHGGSMRYVLGHRGAYSISPAVDRLREKEAALGLARPETFAQLRRNIEASRDQLRMMLEEFSRAGHRVAGYAATSKSTTVTNYCGLSPQLVEFISDTTPIKQGKFSPGAHIPVRPYEEFQANYPDYGLLFGWNHAEEIMAKEQAFKAAGGKWIVYVPRVQVLA
jgi:methylation protein EvaC